MFLTDEVLAALNLAVQEKFNEKLPYESPRSPYAASKASGDHIGSLR